jgi:hypothetical protein
VNLCRQPLRCGSTSQTPLHGSVTRSTEVLSLITSGRFDPQITGRPVCSVVAAFCIQIVTCHFACLPHRGRQQGAVRHLIKVIHSRGISPTPLHRCCVAMHQGKGSPGQHMRQKHLQVCHGLTHVQWNNISLLHLTSGNRSTRAHHLHQLSIKQHAPCG